MSEDIYQKLKQLQIEDFLFLVFAVASLFDAFGNEDIRRYYTDGNGKENARRKFIISTVLIICVFLFFAKRNYNNLKKQQIGSDEYYYAYIRFVGTIFIILGESLVLYYFIKTSDI